MQKSIQKIALLTFGKIQFYKSKTYCLKIPSKREKFWKFKQIMVLLPKTCFKKDQNEFKLLPQFKTHLVFKLFNKSPLNLFCTIKKTNTIFVRHINFYSLQNFDKFGSYFHFDLNFFLFYSNFIFILFFLKRLKFNLLSFQKFF